MTGRTVQSTKVSIEGRAGGALSTRAEIPPQPTVKTMVRQDLPLQSIEIHGGAEIHLQPTEGTHTGAGGYPKKAVTPWETRAGTCSWHDL